MIGRLLRTIIDFVFPHTAKEALFEAATKLDFLSHVAPTTLGSTNIIALLPYRNKLVQALIHALKYKHSAKASTIAAEIFLSEMSEELSDTMLWRGNKKWIFIPAPMDTARRRARGYNQTEVLAESILEHGGSAFLDYQPDILVRTKTVPPQTTIRQKDLRLKNIEGVFAVTHQEKVVGRSILLLDDVSTTGATFNEARKALLEAGARDVLSVAIAH